MFGNSAGYLPLRVSALTVAVLLASCAVGPDFKRPAPPEVKEYTSAPLPARTGSTDAAFGRSQRLTKGAPVNAKWWQLFRSPGLNKLVEQALLANPNLQAQLAALRSAKEFVYAQQGKYFPVVQANFNPSRQQLPNNPWGLTSTPSVGTAPDGTPILQNLFNLFTAQVSVAYTLDVWGATRRAAER